MQRAAHAPPRPNADLDPRTHRDGVLLDGAWVRARTYAAFKAGDGAFRGPHLQGDFMLGHAGGNARRYEIAHVDHVHPGAIRLEVTGGTASPWSAGRF